MSMRVSCRWVLLEVLDKVSPGSVNWKHASKPPIKMPFRRVENCNQVIRIGKELNFSLVNVAGNDVVQGNKKLILGWCTSAYILVRPPPSIKSKKKKSNKKKKVKDIFLHWCF